MGRWVCWALTIRLRSLPPYSSQLNPLEHLWGELREKYFHNLVFVSLDALQNHLIDGLADMEQDTQRIQSICNWDLIILKTAVAFQKVT